MLGLLTAILLLVAIAVWLLTIPLDLKIRIDTQMKPAFEVRIHWFYGLLRAPVSGSAEADTVFESERKRKPTARKTPDSVSAKGGRFAWAMLRSEGFVTRLLRFVLDLFRAIELKDNRLYVQVGLDDPSDTGMLAGIVGPIVTWLPNARFEPDFHNPCFVVDAKATLRFVPIRFIKVFLLLLFSREVLRGVYRGVRAAR